MESPDDVSGDMLKGLLPQLEQYSETTLASVVASLLHQVTAVPKPSGALREKCLAPQRYTMKRRRDRQAAANGTYAFEA